ncbi:hypothetical protein EZY14_007435 [Kordia sp. TARA_039_SRF]|nr:hypothetical protein EZY14_007435 [Kordia sp. TARA_039_SRF]
MKYFFIKLFKHKNPLVMLVYTFLGIDSEETYQFGNAFLKTLGLKPMKGKKIMLEQMLAIINSELLSFKTKIAKLREEYVTLYEELHEVEYKYYNILSVDEKKEEELKANIPVIKFEDDTSKKYKASRDVNSYIFQRSVPKHNTDEFELIMKLDEDIHNIAIKTVDISTNQFQKVEDVKPLPIVKREEPKKPLSTNKRKYFTSWTVPSLLAVLAFMLGVEGVVFQSIFENTIGFSPEKSWVCATMIVGVTYVISRRLFTQSEQLLGRKKRYPVLFTIFSILFFAQVFTAGILLYQSISHKAERQELYDVENRLRHYQSTIADAYDPSEVSELQTKADTLEAEVTRRSKELEQKPFFIVVCTYIVVSLFSVISIFSCCSLKSIVEQAKLFMKLKRRRKVLSKRIAQIKFTYDTQVERLLDANVLRQLFRYHLGRKNACEKLLSQAKDLDKSKYIKTYRQRKEPPFPPNLNGQMTAQHHTNYSPLKENK